MQVELKLKSIKVHSVRYDVEPGVVDPCVKSLYITKSSLPIPLPQGVLVVIKEA